MCSFVNHKLKLSITSHTVLVSEDLLLIMIVPLVSHSINHVVSAAVRSVQLFGQFVYISDFILLVFMVMHCV